MRTIYILICGLCGVVAACNEAPAPAYISGQISDIETDYVYLYRGSERYGYNDWLSCLDSLPLAAGDFAFTVDVIEPGFYFVCNDRRYPVFPGLYLAPGDSVFLEMKKVNEELHTDFSGARAGAYVYFSLRDSLYAGDTLFKQRYRDLYYRPVEEFKANMVNRLDWEMALIDRTLGSNPDWQPIARYATDERKYEVYAQYFQYLYYHNYYANDTFIYLLPDLSYYDFMDEVDLDYVPETYSYNYQYFLEGYLDNQLHRMEDLPDSAKWGTNVPLRFKIIKERFEGAARDAALLTLTGEFSYALEIPEFFASLDSIESYFSGHHEREAFLRGFQKEAARYRALEAGNPAPEIALPDVHGDTVRLSDLKGKVLYVDFWGTWCYPCLEELPHSLELQARLKDQPVEFVYIGLQGGDDQIAEWKDFIQGERAFAYAPFLAQQKYPGVHLLSEGQFHNPEIQDYMIGAAPTYLLIDADGSIALPRAPRPSDPAIDSVIMSFVLSD